MIKLIFSLIMIANAQQEFRGDKPVEKKGESFAVTYTGGSKPTLTFKDKTGKSLGVYESEFRLNLYDLAIVKGENTEFVITTWLNGAATYNVRIFVPLKGKFLEGKNYITQPMCDLGEEGDVPNLRRKDRLVMLTRLKGKPVVSVLTSNFKNKKYQVCK